MAAGEDDVLRLHVAVDQPLLMGVAEGIRDLAGDPGGVFDGELALAEEALAQRFSSQERHDEVEETVGLARIEQRHDVGMHEPGRGLDLGSKSG